MAALGYLGQEREAAVVRTRLLSLEPGFTVQRFIETSRFIRDEDTQHIADGLRRGGDPRR